MFVFKVLATALLAAAGVHAFAPSTDREYCSAYIQSPGGLPGLFPRACQLQVKGTGQQTSPPTCACCYQPSGTGPYSGANYDYYVCPTGSECTNGACVAAAEPSAGNQRKARRARRALNRALSPLDD